MGGDDILPPGYRFYPTEEELISFYLQQKLQGRRQEDLDRVIPELYIYNYNPWDLPQFAGERCRRDPQVEQWFFFIPRQEKEARGGRPNRLTTAGYWKATGSPGFVYSSLDNRVIGKKRTMVYYQGRARTRSGSKTDWKMNEYMFVDPAADQPSTSSVPSKGEFTVCRVYKKSKCLRAFDRRPAAPPPPPVTFIPASSQPSDQPSSSINKNQAPIMTVVRTSSGERSTSSGDHENDHIYPWQGTCNDQDNNNNIEIDQSPLWDWDSVNWDF